MLSLILIRGNYSKFGASILIIEFRVLPFKTDSNSLSLFRSQQSFCLSSSFIVSIAERNKSAHNLGKIQLKEIKNAAFTIWKKVFLLYYFEDRIGFGVKLLEDEYQLDRRALHMWSSCLIRWRFPSLTRSNPSSHYSGMLHRKLMASVSFSDKPVVIIE